MKPKHLELIKLLVDKSSNAARLSELLDVSLRSVKNYVKEINDSYPNTISSSVKGYEIDQNLALSILNENVNDIPQTSEERVYFIITKLLSSNRKAPTNVYDLCEQLYISLSTLKIDLNKVKRKLAPFDLTLYQAGDWLSVEGLEKNKRKLLSSILYEESSVNFVNLDSLQKAFGDIDVLLIRDIVLETLDQYHYFINDYSLISLILHVTIAIDRMNNLSITRIQVNPLPQIPIHEYHVANAIAKELSSELAIDYDADEINELALLIASRATSLDYKAISKTNIETYIGKECLDLVNHLINSINAFYHINLFDEDFIVRFGLHIRNLLIRSKHDNFSKNPLADGIKKTSPLIYETSVSVASELKAMTGITINDDEIAYIAFHIGSAIETVENLKEKIRVVYYCPNYYNLHNKVTNFIKTHFEKDVVITTIITDESQIADINDTDFILTSIPLATPTLIPIVQVGLFPNDNDRILLTETIIKIRKLKERSHFEKYLRELILPELFEINDDITDSLMCMTYMVDRLVENNLVDENFLSEILERERLSSTAFARAAIPHSMHMNANHTAISILISPKGISWNDTTVNLVIMMSFKKNERYIFNEIYEPITMILAEKENLASLISVESYEAFIMTMVNLL